MGVKDAVLMDAQSAVDALVDDVEDLNKPAAPSPAEAAAPPVAPIAAQQAAEPAAETVLAQTELATAGEALIIREIKVIDDNGQQGQQYGRGRKPARGSRGSVAAGSGRHCV